MLRDPTNRARRPAPRSGVAGRNQVHLRIDRLQAERKAKPAPWGTMRYAPIVAWSFTRPERPGGEPNAVYDHATGRVLDDAELMAMPLRRLLEARCVGRPATDGATP